MESKQAAATFVPQSKNAKLGDGISATYVSQVTCPDTCPFRGNGCYAEQGPTGFTTNRLNRAAQALGLTPLDAIKTEADLIRKAAKHSASPLRLHVVGDTPSRVAAQLLAGAVELYRRVSGQPVWTYTHNWRSIPREDFGTISVLASCETVTQARQARQAGYVPALVVAEHPEDGRATREHGMRLIPCPSQTRGVSCADCGLCMDDQRLRRINACITFAAHGTRRTMALRVLGTVDSRETVTV